MILPKLVPPTRLSRQYFFTTLSGLILVLGLAMAVGVPTLLGVPVHPYDVGVLALAVAVAGIVEAILPFWPVVLLTVAALFGFVVGTGSADANAGLLIAAGIAATSVIFAPSFQIATQWQKAVVLRLGKFRRVFGPGPHFILPVVDSAVRFTDMRIRVTDFTAEKSITRDTVPVHVDALAFWFVWDAEKAMLEVEDYIDAVTLSAQTALRDAIGRNDLATLLSERERLGSEIQSTLDAKTNPWGVTILSVELKEVLVPKELEDALSRKAQAERERQSRVILGSAEVEIAKRFEEASETYAENPTAFQLRAMNMAFDSIRTNKNIVLLPSSALDTINLGTALGTAALNRVQNPEQKNENKNEDNG